MKIQIEGGIEMPAKHLSVTGKSAELRKAMQTMKPGDSFMWDDNVLPHRVAGQLGMKITTRKIDGEGYRVWQLR
jgi:hypothetical protein